MGTKAIVISQPQRPVNSNLAKSPHFDHEAAAEKFGQLHLEAKTGLRRVVAFGLFCFEMQEVHLKQGQFGPWLAQYYPECARTDSKTGRPKASSALSCWMKLTEDTLEAVGLQVNQYLAQVHSFRVGSGDLLLLPDNKVPKSAQPLRGQICDVLDGKTARQLMLEFKQVNEDGEVKRGRLPGCKGTTRDQRDSANERKRAEQVAEASEGADEWARLTLEQCDDQHLGLAEDQSFKKAFEAYLVLRDYIEPLAISRGLMKAVSHRGQSEGGKRV